MKILVIPSWYQTPQNPVRGVFFREQALALHKAGHCVNLLVPPSRVRTRQGIAEIRSNWLGSADGLAIESDSGMTLYRVPWWGWQATLMPRQRGKFIAKIFQRFCQAEGKPDILHGHSILYGGYLAAYLGKQFDIPAVFTEHSSGFLRGFLHQPGYRYFIRYAMQHATKRLAVSQVLADAMQEMVSSYPVEIVGNIVDLDFFHIAPFSLPEEPFVFSIIGGLNRNKRHRLLLRAFAKAYRGDNVILKIVGDGVEQGNLQGLCLDLDIEQQVFFLGYQSRNTLRETIQRSHVIISTSDVETFGLSLVEAMACGKPTIATKSGGPNTLVNKQNGLLVPTGDVRKLAEAMQHIQTHYTHYEAQSIRDTVLKFSQESITQQLTNIYESLIFGRI